MLCLENISSGYGPVQVLHNIFLEINEGEIVTLIGANGAGKTTLLMNIFGKVTSNSGKIFFCEKEITRMAPHKIAHMGIASVPEGRRIFSRMSVLENLQSGAIANKDRQHFANDLEYVLTLFPNLRQRLKQQGGTLSGGEQQMLAISRALMARPRLLLLDEPSLGLAPMIVSQIFRILATINREQKVTILLVEQNAWHALNLARRGYVITNGRITITGSGQELMNNPDVQAAYLGKVR